MADDKKHGYAQSGVDTQAADEWVNRIAAQVTATAPAELTQRLVSGVGDYAAVYALSDDQWIALSCDGVGTKILWAKQGVGRPEDLAQDLLAMNANDVLCVGARPRLFLDYLAVGSKDLLKEGGALSRFLAGLFQACAQTGQMCVGGETAQMPELYPNGAFDLAGFSVGFMKPSDRLSVENIRVGAEFWAWESSGPHSNGFSWLRKLYAADRDRAAVETLMKPTRLYVREMDTLREGLAQAGALTALQAAFHITGSGWLNLLRAQPKGRSVGFDLHAWPQTEAAWVRDLRARAQASEQELFTTFNMGWGFGVVLDPSVSQKHRSLLDSVGLRHLGRVIDQPIVKIGDLTLE